MMSGNLNKCHTCRHKYEAKPRTIHIEADLPEPMREEPEAGRHFFWINPPEKNIEGNELEDRQMKFRKKPVIIEAFQMTEKKRESNYEWPGWLHLAWQLEREEAGSLHPTEAGTGNGTLSIMTLEGEHLVSWGDWIIQGVKGELYPCKPDIFEATYEEMKE